MSVCYRPDSLFLHLSQRRWWKADFLLWWLVCGTPRLELWDSYWSVPHYWGRGGPSPEQLLILRTRWPLAGLKSESAEYFRRIKSLGSASELRWWVFPNVFVTPSGLEKFLVADTTAAIHLDGRTVMENINYFTFHQNDGSCVLALRQWESDPHLGWSFHWRLITPLRAFVFLLKKE